MTKPKSDKCPICNSQADGLDDIHCQIHWEAESSKVWWEMIKRLEAVKP